MIQNVSQRGFKKFFTGVKGYHQQILGHFHSLNLLHKSSSNAVQIDPVFSCPASNKRGSVLGQRSCGLSIKFWESLKEVMG